MAEIDLGRISLIFRGTYAGGTTYEKNDIVSYTDSGELSSYIFVNATATAGQTPSTGGTVNTTYWQKMAKGTSLGVGNNKILTTDASGNVAGVALGTAGQAVKVNSGANGLEFGTAGGVLQVKQMTYDPLHNVNRSDWENINSAFKLNFTATATTSYFLLECFMSCGFNSHDGMYTQNWFDSLKGTSSSDTIVPITDEGIGSRTAGSLALFPAGASVSGGWDDYWLSGQWTSYLYYPDAGQRSTSARDFIPCIKRCSGHSFDFHLNYAHNNSNLNKAGISMIRVTELAGGIIT